MAEVSPGDKVVYGTFVGTVRQLVGDDECVILLRAPMSDGAMTVIAKLSKVEVVTSLPPETPPESEPEPEPVAEEETTPEPEPEPELEAPPEPSPEPEVATATEPAPEIEAEPEEPGASPTTEGEIVEPVT